MAIKKYINIDILPRKGKCIDWNNSIGYELDFVYESITGVVKIIDYKTIDNHKKVVFRYKNIEYALQTSCFTTCAFGRLLKNELVEYKYNIGDIVTTENGSFTIIDRFIEKKQIKERNGSYKLHNIKRYKYKCNDCGYKHVRNENQLGRACMACYKIPRKVVVGINDIPTTNPWMIPYFPGGYEEAKLYNASSNKRIFLKCPHCGEITKTKKSINTLHQRKSFLCKCNDGISYPNKFSYEFLNQLPVKNVIHEWNPEWLRPYFYDNYFEYNNKKYVLEMDGRLGHGNSTIFNEKDVDGLITDNKKDSLAKQHGIQVIRIDSIKSEIDYIKTNILDSELNKIFDLTKINWDKCDEFAHKNIVKEVCDYKKEHPITPICDLVEKYGLNKVTIRKYLHIGKKHGWCFYDQNWERAYHALKNSSKPLICNNKYVFDAISTFYDNCEELLNIKISKKHITKMLKTGEEYKGVFLSPIDKNDLDDYINNDKYIFYENKILNYSTQEIS